ncbi:DNA polymerase III subunit delta' [Vibrio hepatarius]|uniref:DNA polymerase III subunit delta' n=1 Tax=Vibrio hepatarius TaxID=171383 RepID=UPI001C0911EF|nr:DNA polymerase III subunit delta' [Vibrio hepatarius]MBU2897966.1 DNA polymerase III subunit delta' [Vibrio hepatarius]
MTLNYPWLANIWSKWQFGLEHGTFSSATLLISEPGLGTEQLVNLFSSAVMCGNYASEACGVCHSCQLMQARNHPDFHLVKPEKEGKTITVEQIRTCNRLAHESSQLSGKRLFIIDPVESMTESAANALLKTLEESTKTCVFLLITYKCHQVLPTVMSRCQRWQVPKPSSQVMLEWLSKEVSSTLPSFVAHINDNAPLATLSFLEREQGDKYHQIEREFFDCIKLNGDITSLAKLLSSSHEEYLKWVWYLLTDAQKVYFGLDEAYFTPGAKVLAGCLSYEKLYQQSDSLSRLTEQLKEYTGLNSELLILNWLTKFNEEVCS